MKATRRALLALPALTLPAFAQPWADRPVRIVVGFPGGSTPDIVARAVGQHLQLL